MRERVRHLIGVDAEGQNQITVASGANRFVRADQVLPRSLEHSNRWSVDGDSSSAGTWIASACSGVHSLTFAAPTIAKHTTVPRWSARAMASARRSPNATGCL